MDGFTYYNIFDTKGIEYLFIIAFLILLIPFWIIINRETDVAKRIQQTIGVLTANILRIPRGLFYNKNHTWLFLEKTGNAKLGLDDFMTRIVGHVDVNSLKAEGEILKKGELLAEINQDGKKLLVFSPISGEIVHVNTALQEDPDLLNEDPYEKGWMYAVEPSNWKKETQSFYMADEAASWIKSEVERLKDFLAVSVAKHSSEPAMVTLQEGGEIRQHILSELDGEIWHDFQESFLDNTL
ncbi:MAG: glycine cleavage system protein H [Bacteroidales bacterium]|jgi:glycine cleavage system H protein|nr:glycine cleavage system protein H [Bacteroidales bacterium]